MGFDIQSLSDAQLAEMKTQNVWQENCPVHYSNLRVVEVDFIDFEGDQKTGKIVVLDQVAEQVKSIFQELLDCSFPIQSILPIEEFNGDDILSMEANNTSAFNYRKIMGTNRWSSHSFGVAIDINTAQNPYMVVDKSTSTVKVYPSSAISYINRGVQKKGMVEDIVSIFAKYGFTEWGGRWDDRPDYHHFQIPWNEIKKIFPNRSNFNS